ncbi:homocysteine S-methyltransferase family protein, partial [Undibacterium sp. CCC1.1]
ILDGGMGRELLKIGAPFRQPEWSALALMEGPQYVRQVHDAYIAAGAALITTNSYALVPFHLGEEVFTARAGELASLAGRIGREAIGAAIGAANAAANAAGTIQLAGSLPPPFGSYRPDLFNPTDAARILNPLVAGLAPFVDVWLAETQGSTQEAWAIKAAIDQVSARPFWLSFTLEDSEHHAVTEGTLAPTIRSGESVTEAARTALALGVKALLFNCSHVGVMAAAVRDAAAVFAEVSAEHRPQIGVYANAFAPHYHAEDANDGLSELRDDLDPSEYLKFAQQWRDAGATIVGGCCGIGPDHIAALASSLPGKQ